MKVVMHELEHCPNCKVVSRLIERRFGDAVEVEHRVMTSEDVDRFVAEGLTSSPVVEVEGKRYTASTREDRETLLETLQIVHDHTSV